jgi:peptidyl-prolyl cis-trans isomerase C
MSPRPLRRLATVLVIGAVGLGLAGCSGDKSNSDAARVTYHDARGDHTINITRSEFTNELKELSTNAPFVAQLKQSGFTDVGNDTSTDQRLSAIWLTQMIRQTAAQAEFQTSRLQVSPGDADMATTLEQNDFGKTLLQTLPAAFLKSAGSRYEQMAAVYNYYATCPSGKFVSHILVQTKAKAAATRALITSGRESFEKLAKAESIDTQSGANGGGLGCLSPSEFVAPFQTAAEQAKVGVLTEPVKTQFGYHLILVRPWDAARDERQYGQTLNQAASAVLSKRLNDLKVWVNPLYGTWGPTTDSQGNPGFAVIPPTVPQPRVCREATAACTPGSSTTTTLPAGG